MKQKITAFLLAFLLLLCLAPAALADGAQLSFLTDDAGLLTASESAALEKTAQSIAQRWGVGIYIVTVDDSYRIDGRGTYEAAYTFYHNHSLGVGAERNGAILLLSMNDRAFARFYYGEKSEYAFNGYAQEQIEDVFLDNFRENDWYGGFFRLSDRVRGVSCARSGGAPRAPQPGTGDRDLLRRGGAHRVSHMRGSQAEDEERLCTGAGGRLRFRHAPSLAAD